MDVDTDTDTDLDKDNDNRHSDPKKLKKNLGVLFLIPNSTHRFVDNY